MSISGPRRAKKGGKHMRSAPKKKAFPAVACTVLSFLLLLTACAPRSAAVSGTSFAMGSLITANVYTDEATAATITGTVFKEIAALDGRISATAEDSEIAALNRGETVTLTPDTLEMLRDTLSLGDSLGGQMDITLGAVTSLWGFSSDEPRVPAPDEIETALATHGADKIVFEGDRVTLAPGQRLDFGAVGKGEACDIARTVLDTSFTVPAVFSVGGTVLLYGQKTDGPWSVGVRDPFGGANDYCAVYTFTPEDGGDFCVVSTSGSYEKSFTENGKTYHHIIDPATGFPVETALVSVTAVSYIGRWSDALSTALFVNGLNDVSLGWIDEYLIGAAFIFADGGVWVSDGIRDGFRLEDTQRFHFIEYEP